MAHEDRRQGGETPAIEITDEMIEVGVSALLAVEGLSPSGIFFSPDELVEKVYAAMERARHEAHLRSERNSPSE